MLRFDLHYLGIRFTLSFFLVFLSCTGVGFCQDLLSRNSTVEVKYQENIRPQDLAQLKFYIPLGRAYNDLIPSVGVIDSVNGVVRIAFNQAAATFVSIKYGASTLSGYIEPGDTLTASIALDDTPFSFIGPRSVENNLFNNILSVEKRNVIDLTLKKKINEQTRSSEIDFGGARSWEQKSQTLQEYIDEEWNAVINPYKELLASKTIDASAYTIFAIALHAEFYRRTLVLMSQLNDTEKEVYRKTLFPIIYQDGMALNPLLTRVPNGKVLLTAYADSKRNTVVPAELVTEFEVFGNYSHYRSLTTIQQEYMLGRIFYLQKMLSTYDKDFKSKEAFDLYKRKFPQSPFIPIIQQIHREAFEDVHVFYKKPLDDHLPDVQTAKVVDFVDNIMTVDTAVKASSLTTFLGKYAKGATVYVDFWATWCVPCLGEFQYAAEANDLAAENGVKLVYVSIDKKGSEEAWLSTIKQQKLRGLHILISEELRRELNEVYRVNTIPRYMIIDKDGDVKSENAPRPSQTGDLREELHKLTGLRSTAVKN